MGNTGDRNKVSGLNWSHRNNQRIGVAVADSPAGPWKRFDKPLIDTTPGFHDAQCLANPTVTERPDGGYLMVYKAVAEKKPQPFGGPVVHIVATDLMHGIQLSIQLGWRYDLVRRFAGVFRAVRPKLYTRKGGRIRPPFLQIPVTWPAWARSALVEIV
jgi:hypothetical protein